MSILAIVGSRHFDEGDDFEKHVREWIATHGIPIEIVTGDASGADALAAKFAKDNAIPLRVFAADWNKYGSSAGPIRNTQIVAACTHVLAFPNATSRGTQDTIKKAKVANKHVTEHKIK